MHGRVERVEWPTVSLARVTLNGAGLAPGEPTDSYVNVAIPPAGAPFEAPFDLDELKALPREQRPHRRDYTVRAWDPGERQLTLAFVVHSDAGVAGPWAAAARPGDALVFTGAAGAYRPSPGAEWHLLVGEESAQPATAAPRCRPLRRRRRCWRGCSATPTSDPQEASR